MATDSPVVDEIEKLESYLVFCNDVLRLNKDRFPYSQIWQACAENVKNREVILGLHEGARNQVLSVCFHRAQFHWTPLLKRETAREPFYLSLSDVESPLSDPDTYQANPSLMNWDWLQMQARNKARDNKQKIIN